MSNVEQGENQAVIQPLKEKINKLREQQIAADRMPSLMGMTSEDSEQYKERHSRIKKLSKALAAFDLQDKRRTGGTVRREFSRQPWMRKIRYRIDSVSWQRDI